MYTGKQDGILLHRLETLNLRFFVRKQKQFCDITSVCIHGFTFQARYMSSVIRRCSVRMSAIKCPVTVKQVGDRFMISAIQHIHPADAGRLLKAQVSAKVLN